MLLNSWNGFSFKFYGKTYLTIYPGSNTYITVGGGSWQYWNLSLTGSPPYAGIHLGTADNSYQRVWKLVDPNFVRVYYEGTAATGGTPGYPNIT